MVNDDRDLKMGPNPYADRPDYGYAKPVPRGTASDSRFEELNNHHMDVQRRIADLIQDRDYWREQAIQNDKRLAEYEQSAHTSLSVLLKQIDSASPEPH